MLVPCSQLCPVSALGRFSDTYDMGLHEAWFRILPVRLKLHAGAAERAGDVDRLGVAFALLSRLS